MWKRCLSRLSLILSLASVGMLFCSAVVEATGYLMPMDDWFSGFSAYALIFYGGYRLTCRPSVDGAADTLAEETPR